MDFSPILNNMTWEPWIQMSITPVNLKQKYVTFKVTIFSILQNHLLYHLCIACYSSGASE